MATEYQDTQEQTQEDIAESKEGNPVTELNEPENEIDKFLKGLGKPRVEEKPESEFEEEEQEEEEEEEEEQDEQEEGDSVFSLEIDGVKFESEDAIKTHITDLATNLKTVQEELEQYRANEAKIIEIVDEVPEFGTLMKFLAKGQSLRVALINAGFGPEDFEVQYEDEPDAEALVEAKLNRKKFIEEQKRKAKQFEENSSKSEKLINEFQAEMNLDDSGRDKMVAEMAQFIQDAMEGKLSRKMLEVFYKATQFEKAVSSARNLGIVQGKNENIDIQKKKKSLNRVPSLSGSGVLPKQTIVKYSDPFLEALDKANKRR